MTIELAVALLGIVMPICVSGLAWMVSGHFTTKARLSTHEAECGQREKQNEERHQEIRQEILRLHDKLDRLLEAR